MDTLLRLLSPPTEVLVWLVSARLAAEPLLPPRLASAASAAAVFQELPKYVYGQDPSAPVGGQHDQDDVASEAHGSAYSSQPQAQTGYDDAKGYGGYAQYAEGGQAEAAYQREYQRQQGYEGYYDQNAYATYKIPLSSNIPSRLPYPVRLSEQ